MSAISTILARLRAAIWAIDVRDDIANAIEQCYSDVSNPTLKTEALEAALQEKIDQGEMAALTIGDHTITAAKLANGVIPAADATLTETGKPADAAETGRQIGLINESLGNVQTDLDAIVPGLSEEAKEALLACFRNVAWVGTDGQDYYDALEAALNEEEPVITVNMVNESANAGCLATDGHTYCIIQSATKRSRFEPLQNKGNIVINVVDPEKYSVALYNLVNTEMTSFIIPYSGVEREGMLMPTNDDVTYAESVMATSNFLTCTFKKDDNTAFTTDELTNAKGTIFAIGKQSDIVIWNGTDTIETPQRWVNKDKIIGIKDPHNLALAAGYSLRGPSSLTTDGYPIATQYCATSLSQILVGNLDGKTIDLSSYELSTGVTINYGIWYGYIDPNNNSFNGTQYVERGDNDVYVFGKWNNTAVTLPINGTITGKRVLAIAFKPVNVSRDFTQAELREIPSLIMIS